MTARALISTVYSTRGGVRTMSRTVGELLREAGWTVRLAHYMPWSEAPGLSVRLTELGRKTPSWRCRDWVGDTEFDAYQVGARFPEFEWQRYELNPGWREAIREHDVHLVVSGNILPAAPIVSAGLPCLAWVATRYWPDKRDRLQDYPWYRRVFDVLINTPVGLHLERRLANRVRLLALSNHTAAEFGSATGGAPPAVLPMGVDTDVFHPGTSEDGGSTGRARLGFVGRLTDPRKNVSMLVEVMDRLSAAEVESELHLVGDTLPRGARKRLAERGLEDRVTVTEYLEHSELASYYRNLDVFLIPSNQEGLGIVGLEAMASSCPVVSTRCGGPEDYVEPGRNGFLVEREDSRAMADRIQKILRDAQLGASMGREARATVRERYSRGRMKDIFWREFERTYEQNGAVDG